MKYEGRLSGLKLLTGQSDAENVRILASHLRDQQTSAASKERIFFSTCRKVFEGLKSGAQLPSGPLWVALRETGLIETLLQVLIKQELRKSKTLPREEIDWGISEALICLWIIVLSKPWTLDTEVHDAVKVELGEALKAVYLEYGLKSKSRPEDLYRIQYVTVMTMGFVLSELGPEYVFPSAIHATALVTLTLAVIFDPLAESNAIENAQKSIIHKHTRTILNTLSKRRLGGCVEDVAPSIANKYGAERIASKCVSYLANSRYIPLSYTGLSLLGAMGTVKSLHPMFINDGKVHLVVLRWFWEAIRGPQESISEYDFIRENDFDWSILPVDILSVLWIIAGHLSSNLRNKLLDDLVVEGDLIMALGRWFLADQVTQFQDDVCRWFIEEVAKQYVEDRRFIAMYIEPTWRHVLKSLNSVKRSGVQTSRGDRAAQIWLIFGDMLGLVAHPDVEGSVQKAPDFVKCSSLVCPMYGEYALKWVEPDVSGLKCTRCQTVYCSLACQKTYVHRHLSTAKVET